MTSVPGGCSDQDVRLRRLSINQKTVDMWSLAEVVEAVRATGPEPVGLWRESVSEVGLQRAARLAHDAGLRVSSLCRGGFLTASLPAERALDDRPVGD